MVCAHSWELGHRFMASDVERRAKHHAVFPVVNLQRLQEHWARLIWELA